MWFEKVFALKDKFIFIILFLFIFLPFSSRTIAAELPIIKPSPQSDSEEIKIIMKDPNYTPGSVYYIVFNTFDDNGAITGKISLKLNNYFSEEQMAGIKTSNLIGILNSTHISEQMMQALYGDNPRSTRIFFYKGEPSPSVIAIGLLGKGDCVGCDLVAPTPNQTKDEAPVSDPKGPDPDADEKAKDLPPIKLAFCESALNIEACFIELGKTAGTVIVGIVVLVSLFMLPYIGMLFASGDPTKIEKAKEMLTAWLSGLLLVVFSGALIYIVSSEIIGVK